MNSIVGLIIFAGCFCCFFGFGQSAQASTPTVKEAMDKEWNKLKSLLPVSIDPLKLNPVNQTFCTCGVFLSGQFKKDSNDPPVGHPALMHEQDTAFPCTPIGAKQCSNKCLEMVNILSFYRIDIFVFKMSQGIDSHHTMFIFRWPSICRTLLQFSAEALIVMYSENAPTCSSKTAAEPG